MLNNALKTFRTIRSIKKLKDPDQKVAESAKRFLLNLFSEEKGIFLKIGQILGSSDSSLNELKKIPESTNIKPFPLSDLIPSIEEALGRPWTEVFADINSAGIPASIGQVHKATLKNGDKVAIKIQYPFIKEQIEKQLKVLNLLPVANRLSPIKKWGLPVDEYKNLILEKTIGEIDYKNEIEQQKNFIKKNSNNNLLVFSNIYDQYQTDYFYMQSWIDGDSLSEVIATWTTEEKNRAGEILLKSFLSNIFDSQFIQGDSHPGNYLFIREDKTIKVGMIDFGNCHKINPDFSIALASIISKLIQDDENTIYEHLVLMGFDESKLKHIKKQVIPLCKLIFAPFIANYAFDLKKWNLNKDVDLILGEYKWWLRSAGDTHFFLIIKSFIGLKNILTQLDCKLFWRKIFEGVIASKVLQISALKLNQRNTSEVPKTIAKNLHVSVKIDNIEKVALSFPATATVDLEDLMGEELSKKLMERNINIRNIIREKYQNGFYPGEIFHLKEEFDNEKKEYRVFLS